MNFHCLGNILIREVPENMAVQKSCISMNFSFFVFIYGLFIIIIIIIIIIRMMMVTIIIIFVADTPPAGVMNILFT